MRRVPARVLGSAVGGLIVLTNARTLLRSSWIGAPDATRYAAYAVIIAVWAAAVAFSVKQHRAGRTTESQQSPNRTAVAEPV